MLERDAILGKIVNIQNCLITIKRATQLDPASLDDQLMQDVFVLNVQRAAQSAIDMAQLVIAAKGLMLPRSYKHSFMILSEAQIIDTAAAANMSKMAGFRNLAVHDYAALDVSILKSILVDRLADFEAYYTQVLTAFPA